MVSKTTKLVRGAMIAGIFGALALTNTYTAGTFDLIILYGMVIPIVWYGYNYGLKQNAITCIASCLIIFLVGLPSFIVPAIAACVEGMFIGESLKRNYSKRVILVGVVVVALINNVMIYQVLASLLEIDLVSEMNEMATMINQYSSVKVASSQMVSLIPLVLVATSLIEGYLIVMICELVLKRLKVPFPHHYHITELHISKPIGIVLILLLVGGFLGYNKTQNVYAQYALLVGAFGLATQGMAFVISGLLQLGYPKLLVLIAMICILIPGVAYAYVVFGVLDIFTEIRGKLWEVK